MAVTPASSDEDHEIAPEARTAVVSDGLHADVRGWKLLRHVEFYQQFLLLGSLTGIGLMTIKYGVIPFGLAEKLILTCVATSATTRKHYGRTLTRAPAQKAFAHGQQSTYR